MEQSLPLSKAPPRRFRPRRYLRVPLLLHFFADTSRTPCLAAPALQVLPPPEHPPHRRLRLSGASTPPRRCLCPSLPPSLPCAGGSRRLPLRAGGVAARCGQGAPGQDPGARPRRHGDARRAALPGASAPPVPRAPAPCPPHIHVLLPLDPAMHFQELTHAPTAVMGSVCTLLYNALELDSGRYVQAHSSSLHILPSTRPPPVPTSLHSDTHHTTCICLHPIRAPTTCRRGRRRPSCT